MNLHSKSTGCQLKINTTEQKIPRDHLNENIADTNQTKSNEILEEVKAIMTETVFLFLIACDSKSALDRKTISIIILVFIFFWHRLFIQESHSRFGAGAKKPCCKKLAMLQCLQTAKRQSIL